MEHNNNQRQEQINGWEAFHLVSSISQADTAQDQRNPLSYKFSHGRKGELQYHSNFHRWDTTVPEPNRLHLHMPQLRELARAHAATPSP